MPQYDLAIVGAGVTGLIALCCLPQTLRASWRICIIDPSFSAGDLGTKWGPIMSNTTAKQIRDAIRKVSGFVTTNLAIDKYGDAENVPLHILASDVQQAAATVLLTVDCMTDYVTSLIKSDSAWQITFRKTHTPVSALRVFLCTGGEPRSLDISRPSIPLEVAFDPARLQRNVGPTDTVTVFGAAHSGALVVRNLHNIGARTFLVHKRSPEKPFLYARDGEYEGVKADAVQICDDISGGKYTNLTLLQYNDTAAVANAILRSKFVVYAIGFHPRYGISIDGQEKRGYNPKTGEIQDCPGIWGFGTAYPNSTDYNGTTYYDVGIPSFVEHILASYIFAGWC